MAVNEEVNGSRITKMVKLKMFCSIYSVYEIHDVYNLYNHYIQNQDKFFRFPYKL